MKDEIHPPYQEILFVDNSTGFKFVCGSALQPKGTETFEGKEYPVYYVTVSSSSHPFFTGSSKLVDTEKRVEKFINRYAKKNQQQQQQQQQKKQEEPAPVGQAKQKLKKKK